MTWPPAPSEGTAEACKGLCEMNGQGEVTLFEQRKRRVAEMWHGFPASQSQRGVGDWRGLV